jgi:hypothetical protein
MGKFWIPAFLLFGHLVPVSLMAQENPEIKLGEVAPVGVRIVKTSWHPDGQTLMYERHGEKGSELGIFSFGQFEGKSVVSLAPDEVYNWGWLSGSKSALVVITKALKGIKVPAKQVKIFLIEGESQSARQVYGEILLAKDVDWIGINRSPLLRHAIVSIHGEEGSKNLVLCVGRGDLVAAPEIDKAEKNGILPLWSIDGTAVFTQVVTRQPVTLVGPGDISTGRGGKNDVVVTFEQPSKKLELSGLVFTTTTKMTLELGSNVMELMPTNAVFRPVRFRGPFVNPPPISPPLIQKDQGIILQFEKSNAQKISVWLKRGIHQGTSATFLAVGVSEAWIAPKENAVAYLIDGALFVRPILKN